MASPTRESTQDSSNTSVTTTSGRLEEQKDEPGLISSSTSILCEQQNDSKPLFWRKYSALFACFLLMFNSWGIINAYGTFLSYYKEALLPGISLPSLNLIGSSQCFFVLLFSFAVGRLTDAGHHFLLCFTGTIFVPLGLVCISFVDGLKSQSIIYGLVFFMQGPISGFGMACFFVPSSRVASTWFNRRTGFALGVVATGAAVAGLVYPIMLRFLIENRGFNDAVRFTALLAGATSIAATLLARPSPSFTSRPIQRWRDRKTWIDSNAFSNPAFRYATMANCAMFLGFYGIFFILEEWAARTGVAFRASAMRCLPPGDPNAAEGHCTAIGLKTYYLLAIMNASSSIGRLSSSYLADHFGALVVHCAVMLVASGLCLLWHYARTLSMAIAFVILFGAFSGSVIGLPAASMAEIAGRKEDGKQRLGQWLGSMYTISAPFALIGPVIEGHLVARYGYNFVTVQAWSGTCLLVAAVFMFLAARANRVKSTEPAQRRDRNCRLWV